MLLLITVGITGASYSWFGGLMSSQTKKPITIPPGGAYCADGDIKVYVLNNGDAAITTQDIIVAQVDGVDVKGTPFFGDMRSGLVGYWKFDEAGGTTATDSSGSGNTGTLVGNPQRVAGKARNALKFDGVNDYVQVPNLASLDFERTNSFSLEGWIKRNQAGVQQFIVSKDDGWRGYHIEASSGDKLLMEVWAASAPDNGIRITGSTTLQANTWYHVAGTYDGSSSASGTKLYVNGAREAETINVDTLTATIINTKGLTIGRASTVTTNYFNGIIDEVKIYNKAVGDVNVQPSSSGLVVSYPGTDGKHTVRVGTSSGAAESTVTCK